MHLNESENQNFKNFILSSSMLSCKQFTFLLLKPSIFIQFYINWQLMKWKTIKLRTFKVNMSISVLWQCLKVAPCPYFTLLVVVVVLVAVSPVYSKHFVMSILPLQSSCAAVKVAELLSRKIVSIAATARRKWKILTNPISWVVIPAYWRCETFSWLFRQETSWWLEKFVIIRIFAKFA